jgi:cytochrome c oxidase subunit II
VLQPAGPSAQAIAAVWWWMLGVAVLVLVGVVALWLWAMWRGQARRERLQREQPVADDAPDRHAGTGRRELRWIVGGGIALPLLAITALVVFGTPAGRHQLPWQASAVAAPLRIDVEARQWTWSLQYPGQSEPLLDQLIMPVGRAVDLHIRSRDVIHSFWVPRLGGKLDAVPGRTNVLRLQADQPGVFRGQCAEFCGLDHARMVLTVRALPAAEFDAWLGAGGRAETLPGGRPSGPPTELPSARP